MRARIWLAALEVVFRCGGYGSRLYYWILERASDATDWGAPSPQSSTAPEHGGEDG